MPAYIRLLAVLFELHPARQLSGDRPRLPARAGTRAAVRVVSVACRRRDRSPCIISGLESRCRPPAASISRAAPPTRRRRSSRARCCCRCSSLSSRRCSRRMAQRMGREMAALPPLRGYTINIAGSLAGVVAFGLISVARAAAGLRGSGWRSPPRCRCCSGAEPRRLLRPAGPRSRAPLAGVVAVNLVILAVSLVVVHTMARGAIWSPYYKITVSQRGARHRRRSEQHLPPVDGASGAEGILLPVAVCVFGDTFDDVLILGAGSGTDVAAALRHGAKHVDAVEIDPAIIRLGRAHHPDHPYSDPRVTLDQRRRPAFSCDDDEALRSRRVRADRFADHAVQFLRRAARELHVHDGVVSRGEDHLKPNGLLVVYNYFRERWLVDRLGEHGGRRVRPGAARSRARGARVSRCHARRAATGQLTSPPYVPDQVTAFNQSHAPSPARILQRDPSIEPATDDWPFLYLRTATSRSTTS